MKVCLTKLKESTEDEGDEFYQLEAADAWVVATSKCAESHDKDDIWCLFLLFQELSSVLL